MTDRNKNEYRLRLEAIKVFRYKWRLESWGPAFWRGLPTSPGVYCFEDETGKPLYIGKTVSLKARLRQHLQEASRTGTKQSQFVMLTKSLRFYEVASEMESLLLEARLISWYKPRYNAIARDDKSSVFVEIEKTGFPRVRLVRGSDLVKGWSHFGPFRSRAEAEMVVKIARRVFGFCANPPRKGQKQRACFYYHLELCSGACVGEENLASYRRKIGYVRRFLGGRSRGLLNSWRGQIMKLARAKKYEEADRLKRLYEAVYWATYANRGMAGFLREQRQPLRAIRELKQELGKVGIESDLARIEGYDVATISQKNTVGAMVVYMWGTKEPSEYRQFRIRRSGGGDTGAMAEMFRRRLRHAEWKQPDLVVVDGGKPQLAMALKMLPREIPVIALAKKEEVVIIAGEEGFVEVRWPRESLALQMLQSIRDEVHRYGTAYHKRLRSRKAWES